MACNRMRAAPVRSRTGWGSKCVTPSGKIATRPPVATASPKLSISEEFFAERLVLSPSVTLLSCARWTGFAPAARTTRPMIGILNNVCLAAKVRLPGMAVIINIGSIIPPGCQVVNRIPPSSGSVSISTSEISRNQVSISARLIRRIRL